MKVYIVIEWHDYNHKEILKIFKSKEDAEKFKEENEDRCIDYGADELEIKEYNVE